MNRPMLPNITLLITIGEIRMAASNSASSRRGARHSTAAAKAAIPATDHTASAAK